ncbi:MAG: DUF4185 domain-containing protein [Pirellulales bacterium]|nr:DUF4185 domain-containing protein [Pirellulales bacterium]
MKTWPITPLLVLGLAVAGLPHRAGGADVRAVPGSVKKVFQLTGDFDRPANQPTANQTGKRAGVMATDLGSSFDTGDRTYFLFGDTIGRPGSRDCLAWTSSTDPQKIRLEFHLDENGKWLPLTVPGIGQGGFEIPSYGVAIGDALYVVFTTDHTKQKTMGRSVLAVSRDQGRTFSRLYDLSRDKFINVALWKEGPWLYVFGSGDYRASSVCLARVKQEDIERKDAIRYFAGLDKQGQPTWSPSEAQAVPLFHHPVVGELSVAFCRPLERFVMLYNSSLPFGIVMRSAERPWGPWSEKALLFDPVRDQGYGHFIHQPPGLNGPGDTFHDPRRRLQPGGPYGPYLINRYTSGTADRCRVYFTLSTWNPYQVVLMQADLKRTGPNDRMPPIVADPKKLIPRETQ